MTIISKQTFSPMASLWTLAMGHFTGEGENFMANNPAVEDAVS